MRLGWVYYLYMTTLKKYKKNGFNFVILNRIGDYALAAGIGENYAKTYEVIIVQSHNGRAIQGKMFPPAEYAPSNEQWGSKGWTFTSLENAKIFFDGKAK